MVQLPGDSDRPRYRLEHPLLLTEALSRRRRLALLGDPGSGKRSFLRYLAIALARPAPDGPPAGACCRCPSHREPLPSGRSSSPFPPSTKPVSGAIY